MSEGSVRKIQFTGKSSFSLNVPKDWVKRVGLRAQDSVVVMEEGNSLVVTPLSRLEARGPQIDLFVDTPDPERGVRRVISAYLTGCEIIRILPRDGRLAVDYKESLKDAVGRRTIGFEVIEDSLKELTFQALVTRPQVDIFAIVRRMYIISSNMLSDGLASLLQGDREEASSVVKADDDVDRFNFYASRALNQAVENHSLLRETGLQYRSEAVTAKTILKSIERVADHAVSIASLTGKVSQIGGVDAERLRDELSTVSRIYEQSVSSFLNMNAIEAEQLLDQHGQLKEGRLRMRNEFGGSAGLVMEHLQRVSDYSADICEAVVDIAVAREMRRPGS
jgi:phosphate uptake regulator